MTRPEDVRPGVRVRFTRNNLGASERDDLGHNVAGEDVGVGDQGVIAFPHPNKLLRPPRATTPGGWWYVEVESRTRPGEKLYVGVCLAMIEVVP